MAGLETAAKWLDTPRHTVIQIAPEPENAIPYTQDRYSAFSVLQLYGGVEREVAKRTRTAACNNKQYGENVVHEAMERTWIEHKKGK